jgi:hypothetical protein
MTYTTTFLKYFMNTDIIVKYFMNIINILLMRILNDKITIKSIKTNKNINFIKIRFLIIQLLMYFHIYFLINYFDIDSTELLDITYENKETKFRTITKGNIVKIKNSLDEIKKHKIDYFFRMPERDVNNNLIIIKDIVQVTKKNKINIKEKIEEYIESDYSIKILDILDNDASGIELDYFLNYKIKNKSISNTDLEDVLLNEINTLF